MTSRRGFLLGLGGALAAPAIVKAASLMPIKAPPLVIIWHWQYEIYELPNGATITEQDVQEWGDFDTALAKVRSIEHYDLSHREFRIIWGPPT